jgi:hypothetical protein
MKTAVAFLVLSFLVYLFQLAHNQRRRHAASVASADCVGAPRIDRSFHVRAALPNPSVEFGVPGWSWGCVSAVDREGRTIFIADAHRGDQRFIVRADKKLTAFVKLESRPTEAANSVRQHLTP